MHPDGPGSRATNEELNISFAPVPDYAGIALAAAGGPATGLFAEKVSRADELEGVLRRAVEAVEGGTTAVVDVVVRLGC